MSAMGIKLELPRANEIRIGTQKTIPLFLRKTYVTAGALPARCAGTRKHSCS
jgi:hypothetical protein